MDLIKHIRAKSLIIFNSINQKVQLQKENEEKEISLDAILDDDEIIRKIVQDSPSEYSSLYS